MKAKVASRSTDRRPGLAVRAKAGLAVRAKTS
jgi:hypothetical protein